MRRIAPLFAAALLLGACSPPLTVPPDAGPASSEVGDAAGRCAGLLKATLPRVRITEAGLVAGGTQRAREPDHQREVGEPLPEHCLLRGRIDERRGADGEPYHTGFELRLPSRFNGRLLYQGGGGNDGVLINAVGRNTGALGYADNGLQRGFAAVSTDAGHQSPEPLFGLDPQARIEHAWRAHARTAETAKALLELYYGRPAARSYFIGCAGGGRQGMMFTQRFPKLFDGVIAQAPAMRVSEGATIAAAWTVQKFMAIAPRGADGRPVLANALLPAQLDRVAKEVLDRCDAADGLQDGLVSDTALCRINPARLVCPAAGEGCLSSAQADALREVMAGPRTRAGGKLYFPWPWDPGIADAGWRAWTLGTSQQGLPNAHHATLMSGALGFEFATPPDPTLNTLNLDFERDPFRLRAFHREYGSADDVLLRGFRDRGGKLLLFHGMADPIFSALETVDYHERLVGANGAAATARFARTFLIPGMNHCGGGPATDAFDGLSAIVDWVEQGRPPERIVARGTARLPGVERPLCPYPKIARYKGTGDVNSAESFECR
jgi:feruloyl esterase